MKHIALFFIVVVLGVLVFGHIGPSPSALARPATTPQPARVSLYDATRPFDVQTVCGGNFITSADYYPQPWDTEYSVDFMALGGGTLYVSLPLGYEEAVDLPDDSNWNRVHVSTTVPGPVGTGPITVSVYLDAWCSLPPPLVLHPTALHAHKPHTDTVEHPARLTRMNLYAVTHQP